MTDAQKNRAAVARLMTILSGHAPIESGVDVIAPDVVAHVDEWRFQGINVWANWIHYIRTRGRVAEPSLLVDGLDVAHDATITARGRWNGMRRGRHIASTPCSARYRLNAGRIVEIWSTRRNYAFLCGAHVEYRSGFVMELLRARRWTTRTPQFDLMNGVRVPPPAVAYRSPEPLTSRPSCDIPLPTSSS